jgi:mannose-6-phosphate isomerase-like protein (cupin superfamily)
MKKENTSLSKVNLNKAGQDVEEAWSPEILANLNNHEVKVAKFKDAFVWHKHSHADELFLVLEGRFDMHLEDQTIAMQEGDLIVIPKGVMHCPVSKEGATVLLIDPVGLEKTGD